jgi:hypothetical protein
LRGVISAFVAYGKATYRERAGHARRLRPVASQGDYAAAGRAEGGRGRQTGGDPRGEAYDRQQAEASLPTSETSQPLAICTLSRRCHTPSISTGVTVKRLLPSTAESSGRGRDVGRGFAPRYGARAPLARRRAHLHIRATVDLRAALAVGDDRLKLLRPPFRLGETSPVVALTRDRLQRHRQPERTLLAPRLRCREVRPPPPLARGSLRRCRDPPAGARTPTVLHRSLRTSSPGGARAVESEACLAHEYHRKPKPASWTRVEGAARSAFVFCATSPARRVRSRTWTRIQATARRRISCTFAWTITTSTTLRRASRKTSRRRSWSGTGTSFCWKLKHSGPTVRWTSLFRARIPRSSSTSRTLVDLGARVFSEEEEGEEAQETRQEAPGVMARSVSARA